VIARGLGYRHYVLSALLLAYAFNFLDRQVLAIAMEAIKTDLSLTDTQLGLLNGIGFAAFYSIVGVPIARWADRGNRRLIISLSLGLLSAAVALCSAVTGFAQLVMVRMGVGVGEAGIVPPAHSLLAAYFPRPERLRAMSLFLLGGPLSMAAGYLLGGWITQWAGWRSAFWAVAALGVFLTVLVALTVREPRSLPASMTVTEVTPAKSVRLGTLMSTLWRQPTFRNLLLAFLVEALCGNGLLQWIPVFFLRVHGMSTGELGTWLAVNWGLGNALGTLAGGYLTGRFMPEAERFQLKIMMLIACVYVPLNLAVLLLPATHVALGVLFVGAFVNALASAPGYSLIQSLVPESMRATAVAAIFLVSNLIGLGFGPVIVGWLSDLLAGRYGAEGLRYALLCCAPGYLLVAACYRRASRTVMSDIAEVEVRSCAPTLGISQP